MRISEFRLLPSSASLLLPSVLGLTVPYNGRSYQNRCNSNEQDDVWLG